MKRKHFLGRPAAVAVVAGLAVAVGACGGSDDGDNDHVSAREDKATAQSQTHDARAQQLESNDPETQLRATFHQFQDDFRAGAAEAMCAHFTPAAAAKTAENIGGKRYKSCAEAMAAFIDAYGDEYGARPKIVKVKLADDRAVLTLQSGQSVRNQARFLKTADGWKLETPLETPFS